jgi:hypothetical protein
VAWQFSEKTLPIFRKNSAAQTKIENRETQETPTPRDDGCTPASANVTIQSVSHGYPGFILVKLKEFPDVCGHLGFFLTAIVWENLLKTDVGQVT